MRMWLLGGLVAVGSAGIVACGGMETDEEIGTQVAAHKNQNECKVGEEQKICRNIEGDGNITHVFLDLPECFDESAITRVKAFDAEGDLIREYPASRLHDNGGPCQSEVERDLWFPLQGNQDFARICVFFESDENDKVPEDIGIGFKFGGTCVPDEVDNDCDRCKDKNNHDDYGNDGKDKDGKHYNQDGVIGGDYGPKPRQIDGIGDAPKVKVPGTPVLQ